MKRQIFTTFAKNSSNVNTLMAKTIEKLINIAIMHVYTEVLHLAHVIWNMLYLKKNCNLKYIAPKKIIVAFHNGSNYNYNFITNKLTKEFQGEFNCPRGNTEKSKYRIKLFTKESFMKNLNKQFDNAYRFSNLDINKFILLMRKGVYPYENIDDSEKFNKT